MVQPCDTSPQELRYDANETLEALHAEIVTTLHALLKSSFFYKEHFEQVKIFACCRMSAVTLFGALYTGSKILQLRFSREVGGPGCSDVVRKAG